VKNAKVLYCGKSVFAIVAVLTLFGLAGGAFCQGGSAGVTQSPQKMVIDDFSAGAKGSVSGKNWEFVTDRVMGGTSKGKMEFVTHDGASCLHMAGTVSHNKRSAFIQARLDLGSKKRKNFDAGRFDGIQLKVKGNGREYAVHLKTANTWFGWEFYRAEFATDGTWQEIKIGFEQFKPVSLKKRLDKTKLRRIAIVAGEKDSRADIFIDEIVFYKGKDVYNKLTGAEKKVIIHKGTEPAFSGKYNDHYEKGIYICKQCGAELYESSSKFKSGCGWPSFDDEIANAVKRQVDADGRRTEIICAQCGGHLGHVFSGEGYTPKDTRHCVNSISLKFSPGHKDSGRAIFASGCFWGTEYHFKKQPGVISTTVGYTGGVTAKPTYKQVCSDKTGHAEAVEVVYDRSKISYEQLAKLFFETHDFTELNRQGPDVGTQYRSGIFYLDEQQKEIADKLVAELKEKGFEVKTEISRGGKFWAAEDYHQDYFEKTGKQPYCHIYKKIF